METNPDASANDIDFCTSMQLAMQGGSVPHITVSAIRLTLSRGRGKQLVLSGSIRHGHHLLLPAAGRVVRARGMEPEALDNTSFRG